MLGFGGHFLTKARGYSLTFRDLRAARITYRRTQDSGPTYAPIRTADHIEEETTVPIPPELVRLLRWHLETFGSGPDGRIFRSVNGNPISPSTYDRVWDQARRIGLSPEQYNSVLLKRPYDLRHAGITVRLYAGVPDRQVAE